MAGSNPADAPNPVAPSVEKNAVPPPGKLLPVMNALLDVSVPAPPKYAVGRAGQFTGLLVLGQFPTTGVQGKPVWAVTMLLTSQPPSTCPTASLRFLKIGRSHKPDATK